MLKNLETVFNFRSLCKFVLEFFALKNYIVFLLIFLLLAPPTQAHTYIIVVNDEIELHTNSNVNDSHINANHHNDSDKEKKSEHHHHCSNINIEIVFFNSEFQLNHCHYSNGKEKFLFSNDLYSSDYLDTVFQPPRVV